MNEPQITALVAEMFGREPLSVVHQPFGHCSVTYAVALPGRSVMVRTNTDPKVFATTQRNLAILSALGLPVPQVIAADFTLSRYPFAWMILDKIPGCDLRYALGAMTFAQMTQLAGQIVEFQRRVTALPQGSGYGYVGIGEPGPYASWWELIQPEATLHETDVLLAECQRRVQRQYRELEATLRTAPPLCFLDDITVKNVIIQDGVLQGLIDFDCVCYGDPLYWLALTATGVVSDVGMRALFYVDELKRLWGLDAEQERTLALYSATMALDFLHRFAASETPEWKARMEAAVEQWLTLAEQQ